MSFFLPPNEGVGLNGDKDWLGQGAINENGEWVPNSSNGGQGAINENGEWVPTSSNGGLFNTADGNDIITRYNIQGT